MISLKRLKKELHHIDDTMEEGTDSWRAGLVLLASLIVGPNVKRVSKYTLIPRKEIYPISKQLRKNGIWVGGKVSASEWFEKDGGWSFVCDVLVALGMLERTWGES